MVPIFTPWYLSRTPKEKCGRQVQRIQQKDKVGRAGEAFNVSKFNKMYELIKLVD